NEELPLAEPEPAPADAPGFDPLAEIAAPPPRKPRVLLASLNLLLALALAVQLVHQQREWLLSHEFMGPWLNKAYAMLGVSATTPPDASHLRVARTEVSSHPE